MSDDSTDARRRIARRIVKHDTLVKGSNGLAQPTTLLDLSPLGLRARGTGKLLPGDHVRVDLPHQPSAVAKVVWTSGEEFGGVFPTFVPMSGLSADEPPTETPSAEASSPPGSGAHDLRIEYGPPQDRRTVYCPNALYAAEWYGEIVAAGLPFVRILNAQGDVVSAEYLRQQLAG
jgi:hypothetical protein